MSASLSCLFLTRSCWFWLPFFRSAAKPWKNFRQFGDSHRWLRFFYTFTWSRFRVTTNPLFLDFLLNLTHSNESPFLSLSVRLQFDWDRLSDSPTTPGQMDRKKNDQDAPTICQYCQYCGKPKNLKFSKRQWADHFLVCSKRDPAYYSYSSIKVTILNEERCLTSSNLMPDQYRQ